MFQQVVQEVAQSVTPTESLVLVRNLLRTAISVITYTRNLFPEDCYADKVVAGLQIKTLLTRSKESSTLVDWMEKGVFDALEKRYVCYFTKDLSCHAEAQNHFPCHLRRLQ